MNVPIVVFWVMTPLLTFRRNLLSPSSELKYIWMGVWGEVKWIFKNKGGTSRDLFATSWSKTVKRRWIVYFQTRLEQANLQIWSSWRLHCGIRLVFEKYTHSANGQGLAHNWLIWLNLAWCEVLLHVFVFLKTIRQFISFQNAAFDIFLFVGFI